MDKFLKFIIGIVLNVLFAGFIGLLIAVCNLFWLEWISRKYSEVSYDITYQYKFAGACAGAILFVGLLRMGQTRLEALFPRIVDLSLIIVLAGVCMVGLTPVTNGHLMKVILDRNYVHMQPSEITTDLDDTNTVKTTTGMTLPSSDTKSKPEDKPPQ